MEAEKHYRKGQSMSLAASHPKSPSGSSLKTIDSAVRPATPDTSAARVTQMIGTTLQGVNPARQIVAALAGSRRGEWRCRRWNGLRELQVLRTKAGVHSCRPPYVLAILMQNVKDGRGVTIKDWRGRVMAGSQRKR
jgi:hypothetical protein